MGNFPTFKSVQTKTQLQAKFSLQVTLDIKSSCSVVILDVADSTLDQKFLVTVMSVMSCVTLGKLHPSLGLSLLI